MVGSQAHLENMNECIETKDTHPVFDGKIFLLEQAKEAHHYLWDQKFLGSCRQD